MSAKRSRALRAAIEGLERRETPSSHASATLPSAKVESIQGTGADFVILSEPGVNGQNVMSLAIGSAKGLGHYTGELNLYYGRDLVHGLGSGMITAANGDQLNLDLTATTRAAGVSQGRPGVIRFTVTGGTGTFANAKGSGTLTGNVNYLNNFRYISHGRVHP